MRTPVLLLLVALTGCSPTPAPAPAAPDAEVSRVAPKDRALFERLVEPLPAGEQPREVACLARVVQARMLERRTDDPRARARIRAARVECRGWLLGLWSERAAAAPDDLSRAGACKSVRAHLNALQKADGAEAARRRAQAERVCGP